MSTPVVVVTAPPTAPVVVPGAAPGTTVVIVEPTGPRGPVGATGERGAQGVLGAQGVPGPPGPAPVVLVFTLAAASSWFQEHAFAYPPAVRLVDGVGEQVCLGVAYPDATHVNLVFPTPFTGKVILS